MRGLRGLLCGMGLGVVLAIAGAPPASAASQCVSTAAAGGTANALTTPALPCGTATTLLLLRVASTNTADGPTLNAGGTGALPIVATDYSPMTLGGMVAGSWVLMTCDGAHWIIVGGSGSISETVLAALSANALAIEAPMGVMTTAALTTAPGASTTVTVFGEYIAPGSVMVVQAGDGTNTGGLPVVSKVVPAAGSAAITVTNAGLTSFNGTLVINWSGRN